MSETFWPFVDSFSVSLWKLLSTCPRQQFEETKILRKTKIFYQFWTLLNFFGLNLTNFWRSCQNCNLRVHRKFLTKFIFLEETNFFINFSHSATNFRPSFKKLLAALSKLHSTCQRNNLMIFFLENFLIFCNNFEQLANNLCPLLKTFQRGCKKCILCVRRKSFTKKCFRITSNCFSISW